MKKIILIISLSILLLNVKAQVQPVGFVSTYTKYSTLNIMEYNSSDCFMLLRTNYNAWFPDTIDIYNSDLSLLKKILIKHKYSSRCVTQKLFNNNEKIEYIGMKLSPLDVKLYDEDSVVLYDFTPELSVFLPLQYNNSISIESMSLNGSKYLMFKYLIDVNSPDLNNYPIKLFKVTPMSYINEIDKQQAIIYPNPSTSIVTLDYKISNNQTLFVYDYFGKLIEQKYLIPGQQSIKIDISQYKQGMYILKYGNTVGKFIKE